jgi:Mu transposase, C-terminal domain
MEGMQGRLDYHVEIDKH